MDPVTAGELTREEIERAEGDPEPPAAHGRTSKVKIPRDQRSKKRPRYTPVSRRQDRPNAVLWLLRNHAELKDSQIMRLVGTTKPTIHADPRPLALELRQPRQPQDPVTLGLCSQVDLDAEVGKAATRVGKERAALGLPPLDAGETLLPTSETTSYEPAPGSEQPARREAAPTAENVFGAAPPANPQDDEEAAAEADETARVFAKLQGLSTSSDEDDDDEAEAEEAEADETTEDVAEVDADEIETDDEDSQKS